MAAFAVVLRRRGLPPRTDSSSTTASISRSPSMGCSASSGNSEALWRGDRPSDIVPPAVARHPALCRRHAGDGARRESPVMNAPLRRSRPYIFWGQTQSLCETCLDAGAGQDPDPRRRGLVREALQAARRAVDAGLDRCRLLAALQGLHQARRQAARVSRAAPNIGCPYDCGLCPDHEQHSCLALIEITEHCNLTCPVCFAEFLAGAHRLHAACDDREHARCAGGERGRAGPGADLRRRADPASAISSRSSMRSAPARSAMS